MRVLFLNRAYPPEIEATAQYLAELTEDLSQVHEVLVLCGRPNYGTLSGRVFPYRREQHGRVKVWRAWGSSWPKRYPLARVVNQASFYGLAWLTARRLPRPDVVVSLTDPPFLGLLALNLKRRLGIPFLYYCEDLYPDVARAVGMAPRPLAAAFDRVQARIIDGADWIVALGEDMAARLIEKGASASRLSVVRNWVDTEAIRPIKTGNPFRMRHGLAERFVVMYSGNFGHIWDLDVVLDAAAIVQDAEDILFVLVGDGSTRPHIEARIRAERLDNIRLLPYERKEGLAASLSAADLHLVPMRPGVYGTIVPSKIYGILASGTPMVALAEGDSEAARVVEAHRCGWVGRPGDCVELAGLIRRASQDRKSLRRLGERARTAAERLYARPIQTRRFAAVLESLVDDAAAAAA